MCKQVVDTLRLLHGNREEQGQPLEPLQIACGQRVGLENGHPFESLAARTPQRSLMKSQGCMGRDSKSLFPRENKVEIPSLLQHTKAF